MKIVIVGAGLIGCERIEAIQHIQKIYSDITISAVYEPNSKTSDKVKEKYKVPMASNLDAALQTKPDWVIVCVPHDVAASVIKSAFDVGANVLAEKPLGRSLEECEEIVKSKPFNRKLHIGFNYRFYDGINRALKDCKSGKFGTIMSVNMVLGHGNSPDMSGSWKLDPIKDGGVLVDLGVHLLDLSLELCNKNLKVEKSKLWNGFWNTGILDEEAHVLLSDDTGAIFNLQVSLNRWRSTFRLEINGTEGYCVVDGRGRSYGTQTYRTGKRWGWNEFNKNQSDTEIVTECDTKLSFINETMSVLGLKKDMITACDHYEVFEVMRLLKECTKNE
jgi:predicted dehydrogenase